MIPFVVATSLTYIVRCGDIDIEQGITSKEGIANTNALTHRERALSVRNVRKVRKETKRSWKSLKYRVPKTWKIGKHFSIGEF